MDKKIIPEEIKDLPVSPYVFLRNWKAQTGQKIMGYFCTNTPEEMIQAAGFLPVRLLSSQDTISLASRHLQGYSCSLVQSTLEAGLRGDLSFLDGTVFSHSCDSIQRLSDIWAENLHLPFHWDLVLPVKLYTESARKYLIHELRRFRKGLEEFLGHPIPEEDLRRANDLLNENRSLLKEIYRYRSRHPARITLSRFFALLKTATFMPKKEHNSLLRVIIGQLADEKSSPPERVRLFLAGSACDHNPLLNLLDSVNADVVGDDFCTGWRYFSDDVSLRGDPIEALADRLIRKVPCPCKYNPGIDRGDYFLRRVKESGAQGVVFFLLKFCEPHAFDYPYLKESLKEEKIPSLLLEIEPGGFPLGALETRLRAFIETLESQKKSQLQKPNAK